MTSLGTFVASSSAFGVEARPPPAELLHEKVKDYFKLREYHAAQIAESLMGSK